MTVRILRGDVRDRLQDLDDGSVDCCITSPPYWGLRDYGHAGQIGLEPGPVEYVAALVEVFREVRRVLREDGTLWLNLGDSYTADRGGTCMPAETLAGGIGGKSDYDDPLRGRVRHGHRQGHRDAPSIGLKHKDLVGIPWRVAFALQADGWWLRQDIIWHKPNPMPESVRDRCTKAHEYIFLLAKSERYYFDAKAIAEPCTVGDNNSSFTDARDFAVKRGLGTAPRKQRKPAGWDTGAGAHGTVHRDGRAQEIEYTDTDDTTRNKRSVWTVTTQGFPEAHFATFPPALIEPCILAGCPVGGTVLDPFGGAGTTGLVADRLQRNAILIELNPDYADMAERRIRGDSPLFAQVGS